MTTEAESRREKAMPQASSSTDDPAPVSTPEKEPGIENARDEQQEPVHENGHEIGERQLIVEGTGLKAAGSEDAALVEHRAVDPGLMQAIAERDDAQLAEGCALFEVDVDGDARNLKPHNPPPVRPAVSPGKMVLNS